MKYVLPCLILINCCSLQVSGVFEWTVIGKVTDYGQNVTLFCNVSNCCPQDSGWDRYSPEQRTLFIDLKKGRANKKYDGEVSGDGYTLIIQNLTKSDLNVSYACVYGATIGTIKDLLEEDVFKYINSTQPNVSTGKSKFSEGEIAAVIAGFVVLMSALFFIYVWTRRRIRRRIQRRRHKYLDSLTSEIPSIDLHIFRNEHPSSDFDIFRDELPSTNFDIFRDERSCLREHPYIDFDMFRDEPSTVIPYPDIDIHSYADFVLEERFDERERLRYIDLMHNSETQKRYFVKVMIVGKESVGKTCLLRNLLKEDIKDVSSTDGIHIVIHRSKINIENGKWIIEKDRPKNTRDRIKLHILNNSKQLIMPSGLMSDLFTAKSPSNNYARCGLWDFAGQKEFYCTHQAFLTSSAIYLVVADMKTNFVTEQLQKDTTEVDMNSLSDLQEEDYVGFWFDSIHCYRTVDRRTDEESMEPPVIVVLTGKDRIDKSELQDRQKYLGDQLSQLHGEQEKYQHYRHTYCISNTEDPDTIFEKIRTKISEIAKKMPLWGKSVPLKWILLEHLINLNRDCGKHFISFKDMIKMAKHPEIKILEKGEISTFLHFQHEVGNIIFFKDIPDLIILEPQWLANAFRCLVSDIFNIDDVHDVSPIEKRQISSDWTLLHNKGKISDLLINTLFKLKGGDYFLTQKKQLLEVMKKFDILMQIEGENAYIMPSMFPSSSISVVCMNIGIVKANCQRTSWFCMKFKFLPPSFFSHLVVWLMEKYRPTRVNSEFALYRGLCVFDLDSSQCEKLLMTMSIDTIALQIVSFSKQTLDLLEVCSGVRKAMRRKIVNLKKRYGIELSYEQMFKCSDCTCHTDAFSLKQLKENTRNYCCHHQEAHESATIYSLWEVGSTEGHIEKGMNETHSQILQTCSEHMVENLYNVDMICEYLEVDDIITEEMRDTIKHKHGRKQQTKELLSILPFRGEKAYERFIEALKITENTNVAKYLEQQVGSTDQQMSTASFGI